MKRLAALCAIVASGLAAGCASSSSGAAGGVMFADCYDEDCAGYDELCGSTEYLRTPSTPSVSGRAEVKPADNDRPATRTVDRSAVTVAASRSPAVRGAPSAGSPSRPPATTASRRP